MPDLLTSAVILLGLGVQIALARYALREYRAEYLTFEGVCEAAGVAKRKRLEEQPDGIDREFRDGVDGVLAELMRDRDLTRSEMEAAYLVGGDQVEDVDRVVNR